MKTAITLTAAFTMLLSASQNVQAQGPVFGISGGASVNSLKLESIPNTTTDFSSVTGLEAGVYMSFNGPGLYLRPMLLASFLKGEIATQETETQTRFSDFSMSTLEVPLIGGLRIFPGVAIEAGPTWNYVMTYTKEVDNVSLNLNRHALGYRAGVRVTLSRIGVFGHYGGIIGSSDQSGYDIERPSRIVFGATYDLTSNQ